MSRTLLLNDTLWASAKALATVGRRADAVARVESLLSRPDLSASVEADARRLAAELLLDSENYPDARRHLCAAAARQPGHAHTQYLLGLAHEGDPLGEPRKAAARFRRAAELAPANAAYRAAYGRAAVRAGRPNAGAKALLAVAAETDDAAVFAVVVGGLLDAGKRAAAGRVLERAMFRCPRDRRLKSLRDRVRFEAAAARQRHSRRAQDAQFATDGDVAVLPFVRIVRGSEEKVAAGGGTIRRDLVTRPRPHLPRLRVTRADR
jgi:tetratricopeptide (TPR) repeat protein